MRTSTEQGEGNDNKKKIFFFLKKKKKHSSYVVLTTQHSKTNLYKTTDTEKDQRSCDNAKSSDLF